MSCDVINPTAAPSSYGGVITILHTVPEKYVMIVQDMYEGARTRVKSSVGLTDKIPVGVGLHQGSSLSPYLFAMIMDVQVGPRDKGYIPMVHVTC